MVLRASIKVKTALVFLFVSTGSVMHAQAPKITPVAPEAAALTKEVNYPISPNHGLADISIPLTQVESGGMVLPIALSYHSGGFKTNERSTSVGLGFSLTCDIQITRTINGLDDLHPLRGYLVNGAMTSFNPSNFIDYPFCYPGNATGARNLAEGLTDGMPDKFNYRLLKASGSFYFLKSSNGASYRIVTTPYDNTIKITYHPNSMTFTIIDSDGTIYYFENYRESRIYGEGETGGLDYSSWKCNRIENAQRNAYFQFVYADKSPVQNSYWHERMVFVNQIENCIGGSTATPAQFDPNNTIQYYENIPSQYQPSYPRYTEYFMGTSTGGERRALAHFLYLNGSNEVQNKVYPMRDVYNSMRTSRSSALALSEIRFREGLVRFTGNDRLESIRVIDAYGQEVKSFVFLQTYTRPANITSAKTINGADFEGTLYLDGVEVRKGGNIIEKYSLQYDNKFCFGRHLKGRDAWGYVNDYTVDITGGGYDNDPISVPNQKLTHQFTKYNEINACDVSGAITYSIGSQVNMERPSKRCMVGLLSRIVEPSGGYVDFQFEPNKYSFGVTVPDGGNTNETHDATFINQAGGVRIKSITYYDGKSLVAAYQKYYRYGELEDGVGLAIKTPNNYYNSSYGKFDAYSYRRVDAYLKDAYGISNIETITYEPASSLDYTFTTGAPVYYTKVTEYNSDFGVKTGKKVYSFYPPGEFHIPYSNTSKIRGTNVDVLEPDGLMGKLHFEREYRCEKNGLYSLVREKEYVYEKYALPEQVKVAFAYQNYTFHDMSGVLDFNSQGSYYRPATEAEIRQREQTFLATNCSAYLFGEYGLEIGCLLLKQEHETVMSNGQSVTNTTHYYYDNTTYLQPTRISTTNSKGEQITKTLKYSYDYDDAISQSMKNLNIISKPIEEIVYNTTLNVELSHSRTRYRLESFYGGTQSFIVPSVIERSFQGSPLRIELTFDRYDIYGNILQLTGRDGIPVSYLWGYDQRYPIAEFKGATYNDIANASYTTVSHQALLATTNTEHITAAMDERRRLFPIAFVTSFVHKPMVGISSMTDPSGITKLFDYDEVGRLRAIKDHNGNLEKVYDYNLINATADWALAKYFFVNVPYMETFYYTSSSGNKIPYNHTIEGGKYPGFTLSGTDNQVAEERALYTEGKFVPDLPIFSEPGVEINLLNMSDHFYRVTNAYIDFTRGDSVLYSVKSDVALSEMRKLYIPAGEYQVNLRVDDVSFSGIVGLSCYTNEGFSRIRPGEVMQITPASFYLFTIGGVREHD